MSDEFQLPDELLNAKIAFGLEAQGHIPTIQHMLAEGKGWAAIGNAIGWEHNTAELWYCRWLVSKMRKAMLARSLCVGQSVVDNYVEQVLAATQYLRVKDSPVPSNGLP